MKIKKIELGKSKDKSDFVMLWDKTHCKAIILKYSFEELERLISTKFIV